MGKPMIKECVGGSINDNPFWKEAQGEKAREATIELGKIVQASVEKTLANK